MTTDTREALAAFEWALSIAGFHEATWVGDKGDLRKLFDAALATQPAQPVLSMKRSERESLSPESMEVLKAAVLGGPGAPMPPRRKLTPTEAMAGDAADRDYWKARALRQEKGGPTPHFAIIQAICRVALHDPTEVLMHQIERLANELHGEEQQNLQALLIRARNPQAQKPASRLVPSAQPSAQGEAEDMVFVPRGLIGAACAAIRHKRDAPKTLEELRRYTVGARSAPAAPAQPSDTPSDEAEFTGANFDQRTDVIGLARALLAQPSAQGEAVALPQDVLDFLREVATQPKSKPDYWSSCGQCESNQSKAEDLLASAPAAPAQAVPPVLFDGFAVLNALDKKAQSRTSAENVSDVLDAVVRLLRGIAPKAAQEKNND